MGDKHYSLPVKTAAFLLTIMALVVGVFCTVAACFLASQGAYTLRKSDLLDQGLQSLMEELAPDIAGAYAQSRFGSSYEDYSHYYFYDGTYSIYPKAYAGESNYRYVIRDTAGNVLKSNYQGEDYLSMRETVVPGAVYYIAGEDGEYLENWLNQELVVTGYVLRDLEVEDSFSYYVKLIDTFYANRITLIVTALVCLLAIICLVIYLMCAAGHRLGHPEIVRNALDRLPTDLYACGVGLGVALLISIFYEASWWRAWIQVVAGGAALAAGGTLLLAFALSLATRLKCGHGYWWRHSILGVGLLFVFRAARAVYRTIPVIWRWLLICAGLVILSVLALNPETTALGLLLGMGLWVVAAVYVAWCVGRLGQTVRRMARGDFREQADLRGLFGGFQQMGQDLNALGQGASLAVEQKLRSERMKTELITNVSHDIKTPLTSIVNYVDLLQKPHAPEQTEQYLEVLARQSQRLKKLTEDLVEMSKATSGSIPVNLAPTDVMELVNQALAEYEEKMARANLTVVLNADHRAFLVQADGRLFWRVMDNLLGNCVKYAQPGTRVYVDVVKFENKVMISVKNVSRDELNVPAEELMERFVRGDRSRNTEGSGLGLNIAKTLMELQHGVLNLFIDGDLFKAIVLFDALPEGEDPEP